MGFFVELLSGENAKPIWGKFAIALDYIIGDLGSLIRTGAIVATVYLIIDRTKLVNDMKDKYVTPIEHNRTLEENKSLKKENDSLGIVLVNDRQFYNAEAFKFIALLTKKDSVIQEQKFIIKGYENVVKQTIKN
jgi:hypothetical protein